MNQLGEVIVGIVILVGLAGIVVPVLPGLLLVIGAVLVWALEESSTLGWVVFGVGVGVAVTASIVKYLVPGKRLKDSGIPMSTIFLATLGAIVGFFLIPVVGAVVGFVLAIYLIQWRRQGRDQAWPATRRTAGAIAISIGIELTGGLVIAGIWLVAVLFA